MKHTTVSTRVIAQACDHGSSITLFDYGDADYLEDQLVEAHGLADVQRRHETGDEFTLFIPAAPETIQPILDRIK